MSTDVTIPAGKSPAPLTAGNRLGRLAAIGAILLSIGAGFLYLGGWLTPHTLKPSWFVDAFERAAGVHSGFRRNHAKGVCVTGFFDSNGQGMRLSKALVFRTGRVPVMGRFWRRRPLCRGCAGCGPRPGASVSACRRRG